MHDDKGKETGAILHAIVGQATNVHQKDAIEDKLIAFAFKRLYPGQGLNIYRDMYPDTPSITVIKDINNLPYTETDIN
ncbi:MAG: hypothetical protein ACPLX7_10360 [Candidatus Kapaibacteriota bacterium]